MLRCCVTGSGGGHSRAQWQHASHTPDTPLVQQQQQLLLVQEAAPQQLALLLLLLLWLSL
jgi:hypothetical protein